MKPSTDKFEKSQSPSSAPLIAQLLDLLPHETLKTFVGEACLHDPSFRQLFLTKHIHLLHPDSEEAYTRQLQALIEACSDPHGFLPYRNTRQLARAIDQMAQEATEGLAQGQVRETMYKAAAIIKEMAEVINYKADDSGCYIGGCIEKAFSLLEKLAERPLTPTQHDELFALLLSFFENETLKGWDWHFTFVELALRLLTTDREKEKLQSALEKVQPDENSWSGDAERAQEFMQQLLRKTEGEEAAREFADQHLSHGKFRAQRIESALEAKDYAQVEALAYEGIARDEEDAPGQADNWRNYLLTAYREKGDRENTLRFARYFFLHSYGHPYPPDYYYNLMKSLVSPEEWPGYVNGLADELQKVPGRRDYERLAHLYIGEAAYDKLLELLRQDASLERVARAEPYLAASYSAELAALYKELILSHLTTSSQQDHYQTACGYIRRMVQLGARSMAAELMGEVKAMYPRKKALLEELGYLEV